MWLVGGYGEGKNPTNESLVGLWGDAEWGFRHVSLTQIAFSYGDKSAFFWATNASHQGNFSRSSFIFFGSRLPRASRMAVRSMNLVSWSSVMRVFIGRDGNSTRQETTSLFRVGFRCVRENHFPFW